MKFSRRDLLGPAVGATAALLTMRRAHTQQADAGEHEHAAHNHPRPARPATPRLPVLICRMAGTGAIDEAYQMLLAGQDTMDAALHVTIAQEDDPNDQTAGIGGLPTESEEVELDAACLHGPSRRGGSVSCLTGIRNASLVARAAMEHSDYPLLVGPAAQRLAVKHGMHTQDLLTDRSRKSWAVWKQINAASASWGAGLVDPNVPDTRRSAGHFLPPHQQDLNALVRRMEPLALNVGLKPQWTWRASYDALFPAEDPLYVAALNQNNEMSSAATTSGMPWRQRGLASGIASLGAGCFLDSEVGCAGAGGSSSANLKAAGARVIVDNMRAGLSPEEAGMDALNRIVRWYRNDMSALRFIEIMYYVLRKDGAYAGVSLWQGDKTGHERQFTIHDGVRRAESFRFLLQGSPAEPMGIG